MIWEPVRHAMLESGYEQCFQSSLLHWGRCQVRFRSWIGNTFVSWGGCTIDGIDELPLLMLRQEVNAYWRVIESVWVASGSLRWAGPKIPVG